MAKIKSKKKVEMPENLSLKQQFRRDAVQYGTPAFRVWKCRMKALGLPTEPEDYILFGYDNMRKG